MMLSSVVFTKGNAHSQRIVRAIPNHRVFKRGGETLWKKVSVGSDRKLSSCPACWNMSTLTPTSTCSVSPRKAFRTVSPEAGYSQSKKPLFMQTSKSNYSQTQQIRHHHCDGATTRTDRLPPRMTISRASRLYRSGLLTSQQLSQHCYNLASFGENALHLNAYAKLLTIDQILEQALEADARLQSGSPKSLLDGIPVTMKANIAVGKWWEMPNAGSAILTHERENNLDEKNYANSNNDGAIHNEVDAKEVYESDIARKLLRDCGAVLIGITNMDEFGMGSLGIHNGLHHCHKSSNSSLHQEQQPQKTYSPTYNPLPWMHRIFEATTSNRIDDEYWIQQIINSTPENPHGIKDDHSLNGLLEEVLHWTGDFSNASFDRENKSSPYSMQSSPLLSPGGSSSGAAAATAHGSSLLSIGTDTGGSIRLPSAWTSTVGFKPSYGTWSRYGVTSYASSLDTVGYISGSSECAKIAWRCLSDSGNNDANTDTGNNGWNGQLSRDPTARAYHSSPMIKVENHAQQPPLKNIRIGIPTAFSLEEAPVLISQAWSMGANYLQNVGGATLVSIPESRVSSEWAKLSCAAYYVLACAEASSNLSRYDGVRYGLDLELDSELNALLEMQDNNKYHALSNMTPLEKRISTTRAFGFGEEVQRRVLAGTAVLSSDRFHTHYEAAAVVRARLSRSLETVFRSTSGDDVENLDGNSCESVDVMLVPTALSFPCALNPGHGKETTEGMDSTAAFANDVMTIPISLGGFPSVSVPVNETSLKKFGNSSRGGTDQENVEGYSNDVMGLQIFGARGAEELVLKVAHVLDSDWSRE